MAYIWQQLTNSLPSPMNKKDGLSGCVLNGKMYALGGWSSGSGMGTTYNNVLYSTDGITWTPSAKTPTWSGRHVFPVVVHNDRIYVLGGDQNSGSYQSDVHSWDGLETSDWVVETTSAPWGQRAGHIGFSLGDYIYVGFGQTVTNLTPAPSTYFTDLWRSLDGQTWELVTDKAPCSYRGYFCNTAPVLNGEAYFIGGGTYDTTDFPTREYKNDVYAMNEDGEFRLVSSGKPSVLSKLMYHNLIAHDGKLWVMGGYNGSDQKKVFSSVDGGTWTEHTSPWGVRHAALLLSYNGAMYFGTGMNATDMWKYFDFNPGPKVHISALPDGVTALASTYTVIDKENPLIAGRTVTEMGYWRNSSGSMVPKIVKQTGTNTFDVVWSGSAVSHTGGGYQSFDIPDYVVPSDGSTYRMAFSFSYPYSDSFAHSGGGRWLKAGNITGTGQVFSNYNDGSCCMSWTEL